MYTVAASSLMFTESDPKNSPQSDAKHGGLSFPTGKGTFSEIYCRLHRLPAEGYTQAVLARVLYPHARILAPLLRWFNPDHFAADFDFVRSVGALRRSRDFSAEAADFADHPTNVGALRHVLRLRVSTQRLRSLVRKTLHHEGIDANSADPAVTDSGLSKTS